MPVFDPVKIAYIFDATENTPFMLSEDDANYVVAIIGNDLPNTITGNSKSNILDGGLGADVMVGGFGSDIYYIDDSEDQAIEKFGEGNDQIRTSISYTLKDHLEDLLLLEGAGNINGTGNSLHNTIEDNDGSNILDGGAGNDTLISRHGGQDVLIGGLGDDVYVIIDAATVLTEKAGEGIDKVQSWVDFDLMTHGANIENLTLGVSAIRGTGNDLANHILGNQAANILIGNGGDDTLDTGSWGVNVEADQLYGGQGDDTYIIQHGNVDIHENDGEGTDTLVSDIDFSLENLPFVENLTLRSSGTNIAYGTGNDLANYIRAFLGTHVLVGGKGDDTLDGSLGNGALNGGEGNDTFLISRPDDRIFENVGEGIDTVFILSTFESSFVLDANVENLNASKSTFGASKLKLTGNNLSNVITGRSKIDIINASSGNDVINGGYGSDLLTGGIGRDTFLFRDKLSKTGNFDTITDYNKSYDSIQLDNKYMSKLKTGKLSAKNFYVGTKAHDKDDYLIYNKAKGVLSYDADGNGTGKAVEIAKFANKAALSASEFYIV